MDICPPVSTSSLANWKLDQKETEDRLIAAEVMTSFSKYACFKDDNIIYNSSSCCKQTYGGQKQQSKKVKEFQSPKVEKTKADIRQTQQQEKRETLLSQTAKPIGLNSLSVTSWSGNSKLKQNESGRESATNKNGSGIPPQVITKTAVSYDNNSSRPTAQKNHSQQQQKASTQQDVANICQPDIDNHSSGTSTDLVSLNQSSTEKTTYVSINNNSNALECPKLDNSRTITETASKTPSNSNSPSSNKSKSTTTTNTDHENISTKSFIFSRNNVIPPNLDIHHLKSILGNSKEHIFLLIKCDDKVSLQAVKLSEFWRNYATLKEKNNGISKNNKLPKRCIFLTMSPNQFGISKNQFHESYKPLSTTDQALQNTGTETESGATLSTSTNLTNGSKLGTDSDRDFGSDFVDGPIVEKTLEVSEKSTSSLPLKKRKVSQSILNTSGVSTPSSQNVYPTPSQLTNKPLNTGERSADSCMLIFPTTFSNHFCYKLEKSNKQLMKDIEIALRQDEDGDLPLHIAVAQENLKLIDAYGQLVQRGGKTVDRFNKKKLTPLHLCVKINFLAGIDKLIDMGADVNMVDGSGNSAIHIAVSNSNLECLNLILNKCSTLKSSNYDKPNLNSHNFEGLTLLHTAVHRHNKDMIKKLLNNGAEPDVVDYKSGRTPLFHAVESKYQDIAELLLDFGAAVDIPNYAGHTAFVAANGRGCQNICKLLADHGADTRGLLGPEELPSHTKMPSTVKSQLKNKLITITSKSSQTSETW